MAVGIAEAKEDVDTAITLEVAEVVEPVEFVEVVEPVEFVEVVEPVEFVETTPGTTFTGVVRVEFAMTVGNRSSTNDDCWLNGPGLP